MKRKYLKLDKVEGSIVELSNTHSIGYSEIAEIEDQFGNKMVGRVIKIDGDSVVVQVFGSTMGISVDNTKVTFKGKPFEIPLSKEILGRTFDGIGRP
ncbi:V-type ATP synthase subunit B, partial [Vibrio parahaemolyticus]|nr:V-type ATP synthase subunit B [Vibrio parahaemolyticus]